ncbi:MAG: enoyl-CoA hydratase [Pseudomonadota bacterium]
MEQAPTDRQPVQLPQEEQSPYLLARQQDSVLWLTLNRPEQRNPLSGTMISAITAAISSASDDPTVRVIVLRASGPVFSAGHDLREMSLRDGESRDDCETRIREILQSCTRMMMGIVHSPKAVIASVEATATAAGCQLVSACDLAIASEDARFCTPGVNIGGFCTTPLVGVGRNIHRKHAMELALTGDMFSAEDAYRFGLVNRVVPHDQLEEATAALAAKIASKSAQGIRAGKEAFYRQIDMPLEDAFRYANEEMLKAMTSRDSLEGVSAFFEKRTPHWSDT